MQTEVHNNPLLTLFEKLENCKDKDGYTLIEHLKEMFGKMLLKPSDYPLEKFEELSYLIKLTHLPLKPPKPDREINSLKHVITQKEQWIQNYINRIKPDPLADSRITMNYVSDVLAEAKAFEWAGVGLGQENWYLISSAVKRLSAQTKAQRIRFWGKLLCRNHDIYVIEAKASPDEDYASIPGEEKRGTGLNENVYWITSDLLQDWHKLPDVQGKDIVEARQLKKVLTGNLDAPVSGYPFFTGKERNYLRAQIARITASTVIVPGGVFQPTEANNREIEYVKEQTPPVYSELKALEKWVHLYSNILKNGRTEYVIPPGTADPEAALEKEKEAEPYIDRLRAINEDEKFGVYETAWRISVYGDEQSYALAPPKEGTTSYSCIALRPYKWPGALTIFQNGKWQSIYIGYGIPRGGDPYVPVGPPAILGEPEDLDEMPEPNPDKEPEPPAPENPENPEAKADE